MDVSARWLALVFVLALLPSAELVEQAVHVVEHALAGEDPGHGAHHDVPAGEHGCTELVHVCGGHHGAGLSVTSLVPVASAHAVAARAPTVAPHDLDDLAAVTPPHRPPIA